MQLKFTQINNQIALQHGDKIICNNILTSNGNNLLFLNMNKKYENDNRTCVENKVDI